MSEDAACYTNSQFTKQGSGRNIYICFLEFNSPDPNDEPAEILLKRILDARAVRAKDFSPLRKTKPKKRAGDVKNY
jgi:hypothetical protein